jgi:hypothetical protein
MNMKQLLMIYGMLVVVANIPSFAQVTKTGTTAAPFLGIDVGPRGTAMGGAYVAVANDATAMYWNPAGIAKVNNFEMIFSNTKWIADLSFNYAGAVVTLENFGTFGVNAVFLTMDPIERTTISQPDGTGELVDANSYAFGVSYARNLTDQFSIGFNAKYITEQLYHCSSTGFALDVGALFDTKLYGLVLGMSISNYGTKMQMSGRNLQRQIDDDPNIDGNNSNINAVFMTDEFELPLTFRVGMAADVLKGIGNSNLILSLDALHPSDDVESINIGGEYVFDNILYVRAGYKGLFAKDSEQGFNFGGGVRYTIGTTTLHFDYANIDFGILNAIHVFSIGLGL